MTYTSATALYKSPSCLCPIWKLVKHSLSMPLSSLSTTFKNIFVQMDPQTCQCVSEFRLNHDSLPGNLPLLVSVPTQNNGHTLDLINYSIRVAIKQMIRSLWLMRHCVSRDKPIQIKAINEKTSFIFLTILK